MTLVLASSIVWKVMMGASLLGAAAGFVGTFAVLRRRALVGDMLSHAALPGIAAVFMLWQTRDVLPLSLGALATGLLGVACVAAIARYTRTSEDAALGIVLSTFFGMGIVLLTILQSDPAGNKAGLDSYLFGEIASLRARDITVISVTAGAMLLFVLALYKELKLLSFDTGFAAAQGWPTFWLDLVVMAAVAVVTIVGLPICGVVLMAAMLITPAAAARYWTNRLGVMLAIAAAVGALSGIGGCLLAAPGLLEEAGLGWLAFGSETSLPPGPLIVLTGAVLLVASLLFAPERGLVARLWSERRLRERVARDHLLRAVYELSPAPEVERPWIDVDRLARYGSWTAPELEAQLRTAARQGMLEREITRLRFTPAGYQTAAPLVRAHRLWELYMMEDLNRSAEQVHADADAIEHLLTADVVEHLESLLQAEGRLPVAAHGDVPRSPHRIHPDAS
jgi:manganese/zinc/iron transport system permease protein